MKTEQTIMIAKKESEGKLYYELDWHFIEGLAKRMQSNKGKYQPWNWKSTCDIESIRQAFIRHSIEIAKGNYKDGEEDYGHLFAAAINCMILNYQLENSK